MINGYYYDSLSHFLKYSTLLKKGKKATTVAFQIAFDGSHLSLHIMHYFYSLSLFLIVNDNSETACGSSPFSLSFFKCFPNATFHRRGHFDSCQLHFHLLFGRRSKRNAANGNLSMSLDLKSTLRKLVLLAKATASTTDSLL